MMIQHVFIINRAGSLIYDWDGKADSAGLEKTFSYPLDIVLDIVDQKVTVVFGERDGIGLRYTVSAINGIPVQACKVMLDGVERAVLDVIQEEANYPISIHFQPPTITTNEKIILSSTFHSLYTIAAQLSPALKSSGIEVLTTNHFKLYCFQSTTGVKFVVVGSLSLSSSVDGLLRRIYELYADYALKNPFYSIDMPIRCQRFDDALRNLIERKSEKWTYSAAICLSGSCMDTNFSFLNNIPGQKGYIVISNGYVVKSDGDLENEELLAMKIQKMLCVGEPLVHVVGKIEKMSIVYPEYNLEVVRSGKYVFIVKKIAET